MSGWLCGIGLGLFSQEAIIEYPVIPDSSLNSMYPKSVQQMAAARAMNAEEAEKIREDLIRSNPSKTTFLNVINKDHFDIGSNTHGIVYKKIKISKYAELIEMHKNSSKKWIDEEFHYERVGAIVGYKRIEEVLSKQKIIAFMKNPISYNCILQNALNNCYFLTALASLSEKEYRAKNLFGCPLQINKNGIYMAKLLFDGVYQEVVVDDLFPVDKYGYFAGCHPLLCGNTYDIWVMVLEKCWTKLLGGYRYVNHRWNEQSLFAISGAPVITQFLSYNKQYQDKLFETSIYNYQKDSILTCGTDGSVIKDSGLIESHSYSVLGVFKIQDKKIVLLRNPWGDTEYKQKLVLTQLQTQLINVYLDNTDKDGMFYMLWQDFIDKYKTISICLIDDNAHYYYSTKDYDHQKPQYYSLVTNSSEERPICFSFSQICQFNHCQDYRDIVYSNITVIISRMEHNTSNRLVYTYYGTYTYMSKFFSNNFFLPISSFPTGQYIFRVVVSHPNMKATTVTLGSYSRLKFSIKPIFNVDDDEFVELNLISKAKKQKSQPIILLQGDAAWNYHNFEHKNNLGFIIIQVKEQAKFKYKAIFTQQHNKDIIFMGVHRDKKNFKVVVDRGTQIVIVYSYKRYTLGSQEYFKEIQFQDNRLRPKPRFQAIF